MSPVLEGPVRPARPRSRHRREDPHDHYDLWVTLHKVTHWADSRLRALEDAAHMRVGTDPRSPLYGQERRSTRGVWREELRRAGRRRARREARKHQLGRDYHRAQQFSQRWQERGAASALAHAALRAPMAYLMSWVRMFVAAFVVVAVVLFALWYGVVRPVLGPVLGVLQAVPQADERLDELAPPSVQNGEPPSAFNPFLLPGGGAILGSSYATAGAGCPVPAGGVGEVERGQLVGVAHAAADRLRRLATAEVDAAAMTAWGRGAARQLGEAWGVFDETLERETPVPTRPGAPLLAPGASLGPQSPGAPAAAIVPAVGGSSSEVQAFIASIVEQESGGRYDALGKVIPKSGDRAYGRYQVMGANVGPWSEQYLGRRISPLEFLESPELQDRIAQGHLTALYTAHGPRGAAAAWYSGQPGKHLDTRPQFGGPSIKSYVDEVVGRMGQAPAASSTDTSISCGGGAVVAAGLQEYGTKPGAWGGHPNGRIPAQALSALPFAPQHKLRADAAAAATALAAAFERGTGERLVVGSSYRTYETQQSLVREKGLYSQGGLAAAPGTSNHGWGLALDLSLSKRGQAWMRANGPRFGFVEDTPREPWHWAFYPRRVQAPAESSPVGVVSAG